MSRIDLTRHNLSWTLFLFAGVVALFWVRGVSSPAVWEVPPGLQMPLGEWLDRGTALLPEWLCNLTAALIVFWNGLALSRIISRNMILLERSYLPFILYLLIACGYRFGGPSLVPFAVAGLAVTAYELMINSFRREINYTRSFDSALLLSLCVLLYAPAVALIPLLPCGLVIFKKGWREWVTSFTGLLLPFGIASYIYWGLGHPFSHLWHLFRDILTVRLASPAFSVDMSMPLLLIFGGAGAILLLVGLFVIFTRQHGMRTRPRKTIAYLIWVLLFSAALVVAPGGTPNDLIVLGLPLSVVMTIALNRIGNVFSNVAYLILLGSILFYNLHYLLIG